MPDRINAILVVIGLSAVGVVADTLLKRSSQTATPLFTGWFAAGMTVYALTAFGWVYAMLHLNLASIGVIYAASTTVLLTVVGVLCFDERLRVAEAIGIVLAIAAVWLTARFSS